MRVLIVGAGVAGLTLAAKLRRQGRQPVVVERSAAGGDGGYAISLFPLGSCVLHGLGGYRQLLERGVRSRRYEMVDGTGRPMQRMDMSVLTRDAGPAVTVPRSDLVDVLRDACGDVEIRPHTGVTALRRHGGTVHTSFSDGSDGEFDLVVGCDGLHSATRELAGIAGRVHDTGWTVWTWWGPGTLVPTDTGREYWGGGWFLGAYPVRDRCMYVVGLPNRRLGPDAEPGTARDAVAGVLARLAAHEPAAADLLPADVGLYPWPMTDVRAAAWSRGRVALCGDAAVGFLPTAGVGASNALRGAAALADELSRADAEHVESALEMYARRCRRLVQGNQHDSRNLARYMFRSAPALCAVRNQILRHYPVRLALRQITRSMRQPF